MQFKAFICCRNSLFVSGNLFWVVLWYVKLFAGYKTISWLLCSELHPTGNALSYFYLYWKKSNFHSRPININLIWALDKKICFLHCQLTLSVLCTPAGSFTTSEEHLKGLLFHFLTPAEQTFHLSIWFTSSEMLPQTYTQIHMHSQTYTSRCEKYEKIFRCKLWNPLKQPVFTAVW